MTTDLAAPAADLAAYAMLLDGIPAASRSGRTHRPTDPHTGQRWAEAPDGP